MISFIRKLLSKPDRRAITWDEAARVGMVQQPTLSGVRVDEESALALSTVYRASRIISESVGTLPLKLYSRTSQVRQEAKTHYLWSVLRDEVNPEVSSLEFFTQLMWWAVLYGNAYAEVVKNNAGEVTELYPIHPSHVRPVRDQHGSLVYAVRDDHGGEVALDHTDVFMIRGPSPDGSTGYRLVKLARESLGFSLALDRFGSSYFGNSCKVGGVLKTAGQLSEQARDNLRRSWANSYQGVDNVGKVPVLEEGLDFTPFQISNEAGQYTETRQHQVYEICRWLGVDPIFVFAFGSNPGGVAEQQTRNFLQFTLNPWLRKIETEISRKLIQKLEREELYAEFTREALIQMDTKTQHEVWGIGLDKGFYQVDEVRAWLNLDALPEPEPTPEPEVTPDGTTEQSDQLSE